MSNPGVKEIENIEISTIYTYAGALTGKYTPENPPTGPRRQIYTPEFLTRVKQSQYFESQLHSKFQFYC